MDWTIPAQTWGRYRLLDLAALASAWTFGAFGTSCEVSPTFKFPATGTYPVTLVGGAVKERRSEGRLARETLSVTQVTLRPGGPVEVVDLSPQGIQVESAPRCDPAAAYSCGWPSAIRP